jgi:hypothetical protein
MIHALKHGHILLLLAAILFFWSCTDESAVSPDIAESDTGIADFGGTLGRGNVTITVPFKAKFFTAGGLVFGDISCGPPPIFLNIQEGDGQATHLGKFEVYISFCMDVSDFLDDGQLTEGESLPYDNGVGTFTAANGDELWFTISGAVLPSDHPDFDFEFFDPFEFTGGTGRFQNAGGNGVTYSFVNASEGRTEHHWTGSLTLHPGR